MARKTIVRLIDDIDGGPADKTVHFGWAGTHYQADLSAEHAAELEQAMAKFVAVGRRVGGSSARQATPAAKSEGRTEYLSAVRQWAVDHGHEVAPRGRIAASVIGAYEAAKEASEAKPGKPARAPRRKP